MKYRCARCKKEPYNPEHYKNYGVALCPKCTELGSNLFNRLYLDGFFHRKVTIDSIFEDLVIKKFI
ncbi:MAG: hypothetical protein RL621_318 [Bacteroidota bacterium]|jgi:late competence protein required for DNA uptake (superfamily II DNA/RNA helicase)